MTQRMARPGAAPAVARSTQASPSAGPSPTLEDDLAAAMGFLGGPAETIDASLARTGAPPAVQRSPKKGGGKKPPTPKAEPKPPPEPLRFVTKGGTVYIHSDCEGYTEPIAPPPDPFAPEPLEPSPAPVAVKGKQYVTVLEEHSTLMEGKKKKGEKVSWYEPVTIKVAAAEGEVWLSFHEIGIVDEQAQDAYESDQEGKSLAGFVTAFNRELAPVLHVFDGGLTTTTAATYFSAEQRTLLWDYLRAKLYPMGLFSDRNIPRGTANVDQRILLSAHILSTSQFPEDGKLRRGNGEFCYHWVQLVWTFAGVNEAAGANAGVRGVTGMAGEVSYGGGRQQLVDDETGFKLGQRPEDSEGKLGHYAGAARYEDQVPRKQSLSKDELTVIKPGDWLFVYNANKSAGGGHSVIFASWGTTKQRDAAPSWEGGPPALKSKDHKEEHDGERSQIDFAYVYVYSQTDNTPETNAERGGHLHGLRIGPYYYRQYKTWEESKPDKKTGVVTTETKEQEDNEIVPVYSIIRAADDSDVPNSPETLLRFDRGKALQANLEYLTGNRLALDRVYDHLVTRAGDALGSARLEDLAASERTICEDIMKASTGTIADVSLLAAMVQRLEHKSKKDKPKVDGRLASLGLDVKGLGGGAGPRAGDAVDVVRIAELAFEGNASLLRQRNLDGDKLYEVLVTKIEALAKTSTLDGSAGDLELEAARRACSKPYERLSFAIAQWQLRSKRAVTGWAAPGDVFSAGELKSARLPKDPPPDADGSGDPDGH